MHGKNADLRSEGRAPQALAPATANADAFCGCEGGLDPVPARANQAGVGGPGNGQDAVRASAIAAAEKARAAVPGPRNYLNGLPTARPILPENALCFFRDQPFGLDGKAAWHHRHVLILNFQTAGTVIVDELFVELAAGEALLILPHQFHHYAGFKGDRLLWVFMTFEQPDPAALLPLKHQPLTLSPGAWQAAGQVLEDFPPAAGGDETANRSLTLQLAQLLVELQAEATRRAARAALEPPATVGQDAGREIVQRVGRYVLANLEQPLPLEAVAEAVAVSQSHLRNTFRQQTGVGLGSYIRRLRLHRACVLLDTTSASVKEVAERCGFAEASIFSRTFSRVLGLSPAAYRERPRGG